MKENLWQGWLGCAIYVVIGILIIIGIFYYDKKDEQSRKAKEATDKVENEQAEKEEAAFKLQMDDYCSKSAADITGRELYRCNDYINYGLPIAQNLDELLKEHPNIPNFCDRKIIEMKVNELAQCLNEPIDNTEE